MDSKKDIELLLSPAVYVLSKMGKIGKHKLFKLLYFADKYHLSKFGRPVTHDIYIAMVNGPVPSRLYDYLKGVAGKNSIPIPEDFLDELRKYIAFVEPFYVINLKPFNPDYLSEKQVKSLDNAIAEYGKMSFDELTNLSHDAAWNSAIRNTEIEILEIAKGSGANAYMIQYINQVR